MPPTKKDILPSENKKICNNKGGDPHTFPCIRANTFTDIYSNTKKTCYVNDLCTSNISSLFCPVTTHPHCLVGRVPGSPDPD